MGFKIKNSIIKITNAIDIWNESVNQLVFNIRNRMALSNHWSYAYVIQDKRHVSFENDA